MTQTTTNRPSSIVVPIAVAAILAATAYIAVAKDKQEDDRSEVVILTATLQPRVHNPVHLMVEVGGAVVVDLDLSKGPWQQSFTVPKGTQVSMHMSQFEGGQMDCSIVRDGQIISQNDRTDAGSIRCWHNRA